VRIIHNQTYVARNSLAYQLWLCVDESGGQWIIVVDPDGNQPWPHRPVAADAPVEQLLLEMRAALDSLA